jgi:hypothetical protein
LAGLVIFSVLFAIEFSICAKNKTWKSCPNNKHPLYLGKLKWSSGVFGGAKNRIINEQYILDIPGTLLNPLAAKLPVDKLYLDDKNWIDGKAYASKL